MGIVVATVEIQEQYTRMVVCAARVKEQETAVYLKLIGEKLEALLGGQRKADMECHLCHQKGHFARECATTTAIRSGNRQLPPSQWTQGPRRCGEEGSVVSGKWAVPPRTSGRRHSEIPG